MLFGFGAGIAYTAPMAAGWKWLPDKKGLVSGIILTGFGAGGFVFNIIGTKLMNPKGLNVVTGGSFPAEVYDNFPKALRRLAGMYAALAIVGSLFVTEPVAVAPSNGVKAVQPTQSPGLSIKEALTKKQFWLLWLMIVSSASAGLNVAACYKQFA
jgi:OFA family oxalate/formate antiporter-like MFS transporter